MPDLSPEMSKKMLENSARSEAIATDLFYRLRKRCDLGMREYLAAIKVIRGGYDLELRQLLQMIWCNSPSEQLLFNTEWDKSYAAIVSNRKQQEKEPEKSTETTAKSAEAIATNQDRTSPDPVQKESESTPNFAYETLYASTSTTRADEEIELGKYFPLSRRMMIYLWRFLRRPIADGVADVLDVEATINQAAQQGFYWQPVFRRRISNRAHLLLLIDRGGSMTPCHRFAEDLVETAQEDGQFGRVDVFYFYNVPINHVYRDDRQTEPVEFAEAFQSCDRDTSVLIVSDGGAARGYRSLQRLEATHKFLLELQSYSSLIGWLNPIPKDRWYGSSAEFIAYLVPMQEMSNDGMGQLIDVVRGTSLSPLLGVG